MTLDSFLDTHIQTQLKPELEIKRLWPTFCFNKEVMCLTGRASKSAPEFLTQSQGLFLLYFSVCFIKKKMVHFLIIFLNALPFT